MKYKPKNKKWFEKRIGKRIFRNHHKCCAHCNNVAYNGLIVMNESHADYLANTDTDFANEGYYLNYRDKR